MAAYDYAQMPGAPAAPSYAAPLLDFSWLANLPKQYQEGQQYGVQRGVQTAFKDGFPTDQNGNPDYATMANKLLQVGGPQAAQPYFQMMLQRQAVDRLQQAGAPDETMLNGQPQGAPPSSSVPSSHPAASGPANITGQAPGGPPGSNPAPNTLRGMLTSGLGEGDTARLLPVLSQRLGIGPDDPMTDQQAQQLRQRFPQIAQAARQPAQTQQSRQPGQPPFAAPSKPPGSIAPGGEQFMGEDGTSGQPNAPTSPQEVRGQAQPQQPAQSNNVNLRKAAILDRAAKQAELAAADPSLPPAIQQTMRERAQQLSKAAEQYRQTGLGEAQQSGYNNPLQYEGAKQVQKQTIDQSGKTWEGVQASATQYERDVQPVTSLAHGILSDPQFYSGIGSQASLAWNKIKDIFGAPRAAALQQGLEKINAITTLGAVNQQRDQLMEAGGASARIFSQQIEQVVKSNPNLENTVWGNRMLINIMDRIGQRQQQIRDMALDYRGQHGGVLDDGFTKQVATYVKAHPAFTDQEVANPTILGAPEAPPTIKTPEQARAWKSAQGLKSGDPYRTPDGRIKYAQ